MRGFDVTVVDARGFDSDVVDFVGMVLDTDGADEDVTLEPLSIEFTALVLSSVASTRVSVAASDLHIDVSTSLGMGWSLLTGDSTPESV